MKNNHLFFVSTLAVALISISCFKDEPACAENNTGTLIIQNNYGENPNSRNSLAVFINRDARSSNEAGDLNIPFGETGEIELAAGIHEINVYRNTGSCSNNTCLVSRAFEGMRDIDLGQCEELNMAYGN